MYLQELLNGICCKVIGDGNPNVTSLSCDTSTAKQGCMFFCLKGTKYDGHDFFRKVIGEGCVALVCEKQLDTKALQIVVDNTRIAMAQIAKNFYDNCADKLKIISVVGTNGKTSTSYVLESALTKAGYNTAVIGTNGIFFDGQKHDCTLTTPDPIALHYWFKQMYLNKVQVVVMEASAHAIALNKLYGVVADFAIFTNFSQDHLDFFGTMEKYGEVKKSYFCTDYVRNAIVNIDDELGSQIAQSFSGVATYSLLNNADSTAKDIRLCSNGMKFNVEIFGQNAEVCTKLNGTFNVYNIIAALTCAVAMGADIDTAVRAVEEIKYISGRNETVMRDDGMRIVVDFAHTPDGVENILKYLKSTTDGKLIVVFGCGGNRDKFKRPIMAERVSGFADFAVLTNDNPRYEDPKIIAQDIVSRLTCPYKVVLNRAQATEFAISLAKSCDTVAILGKGSETYQEIKGKKLPYSDIDVVKSILKNA
ncbi:MAG: UDP-N-acetylmuramoyl-L-alanyl-D-glutamate--2,6-diaminopimelate ligase [Corallococcus sp.]|nr:UDP-N-acetylmuramoyl-L-alanyl-D-glutamate--2,6-diaminopimelate ligase [Corallococcus sp.]MCM1359281.1 UDP-N-acetylmuramoyl-L-alanyl-D-glutamate--2,6-diaminopimelate ligase [Corallococcus sp.]MCM1394673.1 UDP-N-acetylmuramoyl-L-alanyl-D-glutamate--2,6-diaminopimelate ligase [Corallococcus sp.]